MTLASVSGGLLYFPWEILRRLSMKLRNLFDRRTQTHVAAAISSELPNICDLEALERFWRTSEMV